MSNLAPEGARLTKARTELAAATDAAREAVRADIANGMTETEAARRYGVTRMTIRAWLGKRKP